MRWTLRMTKLALHRFRVCRLCHPYLPARAAPMGRVSGSRYGLRRKWRGRMGSDRAVAGKRLIKDGVSRRLEKSPRLLLQAITGVCAACIFFPCARVSAWIYACTDMQADMYQHAHVQPIQAGLITSIQTCTTHTHPGTLPQRRQQSKNHKTLLQRLQVSICNATVFRTRS